MSEQQNLQYLIFLVRMENDYTTTTCNLGKRTYRAGKIYRMLPAEGKELIDAGVAEQIDWRSFLSAVRPEFDAVRVRPKVSRWFTANGVDTHHLTAGVETVIPSNLAAFLCNAGYATVAA